MGLEDEVDFEFFGFSRDCGMVDIVLHSLEATTLRSAATQADLEAGAEVGAVVCRVGDGLTHPHEDVLCYFSFNVIRSSRLPLGNKGFFHPCLEF